MPSKMHKQDSDCTPYLDADDQCTVCGVSHANECPSCGGRGFHKPSCPDSDANWKVKLPATDQSTDNPSHDFEERDTAVNKYLLNARKRALKANKS